MKHKFSVYVNQLVEVEIDDEVINDEFINGFKEYMYEFDSLRDHAEHLAQLEARGLIGLDGFVEGYGTLKGSNIKVNVTETDISLQQ